MLDSIITIYETLDGSKLDDEHIALVSEELTVVEKYLDCTRLQAILFSIVFAIQHRGGVPVTFQMISDYIGESLLYVIKYIKDLNILIGKGLLNEQDDEDRSDSSYVVAKNVIGSIIDGIPLEKGSETSETSVVFLSFHNMFLSAVNRMMPEYEYLSELREIENKYSRNEVIKNVKAAYPDDVAARFFVYSLCDRVIVGTDYQDNDDGSTGFNYRIIPARSIARVRKEIEDNTFHVIKDGYVSRKYVVTNDGFGRRQSVCTVFCLTRKGIDRFFGDESGNYEPEEDVLSELEMTKQFLLAFSVNYKGKYPVNLKCRKLAAVETQLQDLPVIKKLKKLVPDTRDRYVLYECCNDFMNMNCSSNLTDTLQCLYGTDSDYFKVVHAYKDEKCFLLDEGFLVLEKDANINKSKLSLADRTLELLYGKNADLFVQRFSDDNILSPEKLCEKALFYPEEIITQIDMLKNSLVESNLAAMQKRLEAKHLPKGIAVLLYGEPGTGKTESVYQIAKATNRKIYHVDISETKSMWFGESEKRIKRVFIDYKNFCKSCRQHGENVPILLFNEADAVISKRKNVSSGNTAQTENAIQNIILEQMETLDGIMIATTNLCDNMDGAFERRFLFKIRFDKPGLKERCQIWKSKLPLLSDDDAELIAGRFDFSGGEIDNIVRKCEIEEIITGVQPELAKIEELCTNERLSAEEKHRVGFMI